MERDTSPSLVIKEGERHRLDEPLSTCGGAVSKIGELESAALAGRPVDVRWRAPRPDAEPLLLRGTSPGSEGTGRPKRAQSTA